MDIHKLAEDKSHLVDIKKIDSRPGPYCMSFGFDIKPLIRSIERVGLANSPLAVENGHRKLTVVVGYRRIQALKSLGWNKIPCRVLKKSELSPLKCLLLNLHDNLSVRRLNDVEKGMALRRLSSWIKKNEILEHYMPLLDLPSHEPTLLFYLKLERDLEEEIKQYLVKGHLSLHAAKTLLAIDPDARFRLFQLISTLKLNINQQKHLLDYMSDVSHNENKSILDLLEEGPIDNICSDRRMNNPQKARAVIRFLRSKIFPALIGSEATFKKMVSRLDLPEGVTINFPPFFESPHYRLEVLFKDGKDLNEKIGRLSRTEALKGLCDPWERDA